MKLTKKLLNYTSNDGKYDEQEILEARLSTGSNNQAALLLGIPRRTVDRAINRIIERAESLGETSTVSMPKVLVFDIESAPMASYLWTLFKPSFNHHMVERSSYVLCWAAKWLGEPDVMADAICYNPEYTAGDEDDSRMLEGIWNLLDEADFVVAHNGDRFDVPMLNTAFLLSGMRPPSPYKQIDTLKMVKRTFKFDTNRLDYLLHELYGDSKADSGGFDTWRGCMSGDQDAWDKMIKYNKKDVTALERLYLTIRAWDKSHPSILISGGTTGVHACPTCGSENISNAVLAGTRGRGTVSTNVSRFNLYVCDDCGSWSRGRESTLSPEERSNLLVKAR